MAGILTLRSSYSLSRTIKHISKPALASQIIRKISFFRKNSDAATVEPLKSEYEIKLAEIKKEEKEESYGFDDNPFLDKLSAHLMMFFGFSGVIVFLPYLVYVGPDINNKMVTWKRYEAAKLIEEREARGELPIDRNFVPPELIETMVPASGDWEVEWLRCQASVKSDLKHPHYMEVPN